MATIRVDPDQLVKTAEQLAESAVRLRKLGAETLSVGSSAPGYDGQFGPRVHDLSLEAAASITAKADRLAELSDELMALATAFAEADRESVGVFERLGAQLLDLIRQAGPILGTLMSLEPSATPVAQTTPTPLATPVPIPVPTVPLGTPVPTPVSDEFQKSQWQLALNARYGFCVHPMTDPDALSNHISTAQISIMGPRFPSMPGPAPGPSWEGLSANRFLLGLKAFSLLNQAFTSEANRNAWEQAEPNVDFGLHYARYEGGVKIPGVEVYNRSDSVLKVSHVYVTELKVALDGTIYPWRDYEQTFKDVYVLPNTGHDLFFDTIGETFPSDSRLHIQLMISTVEYERMYRWPAWALDTTSGQAVAVEPQFYDTH